MRRAVVVTAVVAALAAHSPDPGTAAVRTGDVWFLRGGEPIAVPRRAAGIDGLLRALLTGPTARERERGLRSAIPAGTRVRDLTVSRRLVTVDLAARFAAGRDERSLTARVGQLVRTLTAVPGVRGVRVRVEGGTPIGLFPGYDLRRTVTRPAATGTPAPTTRDVQQLLADLGFMGPDGVTGAVDDRTATAALAFEKWSGLPRDGRLDERDLAVLGRAARPVPATRLPGRRIEVHVGRQVALLIEDDRVLRTVHVSTGAGGATPLGSFRVYRKERMSWSVPFSVWLPWASYFVGGVAFHEFGSVPTYAASHGCIRVNHHDARLLYGFAEHGTPVRVLWERA